MSEENVELVRTYYETFNAEGFEGTKHMRHPEIEIYDPPDLPDADRYVGEAALVERVESYKEIGWDGHFDIQEYVDAGEEVIVIWHLTGSSAIKKVPLDVATVGHVCLFENGRLRRIRQYLTRDEALKAAGVSE